MKFYTNVAQDKNQILVCGYDNGKRFKEKIDYKPFLFVPVKEETRYKTIHNEYVEKYDFSSIYEARSFIKKYKNISNFEYYGMTKFEYPYIFEYYDNIKFDPNSIRECIIDIEVSMKTGKPDVETANNPIVAITMMYKDITFVFGLKDFETKDTKIKYFKCKDEIDLLQKFIIIFSSDLYRPDVITGWYIEFFDIPYIIKRIENVLSLDEAKRLSPWGKLNVKTIEVYGKENTIYELVGVNILDYLALYKKFTYVVRQSYTLDYISQIELKANKIEYKSKYGSLDGLYDQNHQLYIEYNIHDCTLIRLLNDKLQLLELVYEFAYDSRINFQDTLFAVRTWDVIIHNYLLKHKIVVPVKSSTSPIETRIPEGAYVKDPLIGKYNWVVSFDLQSLYPHIIMGYNIGPDSYRGKEIDKIPMYPIITSFPDIKKNDWKQKNVSYTMNGCLYDKNKTGFLAQLMEDLFNKRKEYKKIYLDTKEEFERTKNPDLNNKISKYYNLQQSIKIKLNSLYGSLANRYFRWYNLNLAESITITGQFIIQHAEKRVNEYLNKILKTDGVDYIIASDTDSLYVNMGGIMDKIKYKDTIEGVEKLDEFCETIIKPFLDRIFKELSEEMNCHKHALYMKRESISDVGVFTAKKRYALNVYNNEGVAYDEPELKITGLEAIKSSTPEICRDYIKEMIKIILLEGHEKALETITKYKKEFKTKSFSEIAYHRGINGMETYKSNATIYTKGTPIHVRGALVYNDYIKKNKLSSKYDYIYDKDKIKFCYLKMPNPVHENVISVIDDLPDEHHLSQYIDYDLMFEKAFLQPITAIFDAIGWSIQRTKTLEGIFG